MKNITDKYRYIPIIDEGIYMSNKSFPYSEGHKKNIFIQDANGGEFQGKMRPGPTTFVDFFHPNGSQYWQDMLSELYSKVQFGGLWLDMNEFTNYCDGQCVLPETPSKFDYTHDLPYTPGNATTLEQELIAQNCTHYGGLVEGNVHPFNSFLETESSYQFLSQK